MVASVDNTDVKRAARAVGPCLQGPNSSARATFRTRYVFAAPTVSVGSRVRLTPPLEHATRSARSSAVSEGARRRDVTVAFASRAPKLRGGLAAYEVGATLGQGTFGLVYAARHIALGREVAIKQLWPHLLEDEDARRRFAAEAQVTASLDHPNVVRVYDYLEADVHALVIERMYGGTLHDRLAHGPLSAREACEITLAMLCGLEHAHQHGVLHRDIKPRNLLFGSARELKVADFGLATVIGPDGELQTSTARQPGTPAYMAPEQLTPSLGRVSAATDVWAAGAVLYEMLTGQRPSGDAGDLPAILRRRTNQEPAPLVELAPATSRELSDVVARALTRRPTRRFQSAAQFAVALEGARCVWSEAAV